MPKPRTSRNSSPSSTVGRTYAYRKAARHFLETNAPVCYWCGCTVVRGAPNTDPRQATVDHASEVDAGAVDPMDQRWWVVACRKDNSRRGAEYLHRQRSARTHLAADARATSEAW